MSGTDTGLCFFDLADDGKIALITDFFPSHTSFQLDRLICPG
jgi:hypothetical protein